MRPFSMVISRPSHGAEAVDHGAFALVVGAAHVDDGADVAGDHHAMQADALVRIDADLGDFGEVTRHG